MASSLDRPDHAAVGHAVPVRPEGQATGSGGAGPFHQRSENIWNENNEDIPGTSDPVTFTSPPLPADYGPLDGIKEGDDREIVNRTDSTVVLEQFDVHMYPEFAQCTQVWLASHDGLSSSVISAATSNVRVPLVVRLGTARPCAGALVREQSARTPWTLRQPLHARFCRGLRRREESCRSESGAQWS